ELHRRGEAIAAAARLRERPPVVGDEPGEERLERRREERLLGREVLEEGALRDPGAPAHLARRGAGEPALDERADAGLEQAPARLAAARLLRARGGGDRVHRGEPSRRERKRQVALFRSRRPEAPAAPG